MTKTYYKFPRSGTLGIGVYEKSTANRNDYVAVLITTTIPAAKSELLADKIVEWLNESESST